MNWNQFLQVLVTIYLLYYILVIAFDLLRKKATAEDKNDTQVLFFQEENMPRQVTLADVAPSPAQPDLAGDHAVMPDAQPVAGGQLQPTGAVSISKLLDLAQADLSEYTKHIPY
jgi:hypothetical protein